MGVKASRGFRPSASWVAGETGEYRGLCYMVSPTQGAEDWPGDASVRVWITDDVLTIHSFIHSSIKRLLGPSVRHSGEGNAS